MTSFIGAEYIIAAIMDKKHQMTGEWYVDLSDIWNCCLSVMDTGRKERVDAIFKLSIPEIYDGLYAYKEYFDVISDHNDKATGVKLKDGMDENALRSRFPGRLPKEIDEFIRKCVNKYYGLTV